jgi:zinc-ribbon domain
MQCRNCGAEIADKAIVCYRCGAATTDPVRRPVALKPRRSQLVSLVALMALVLLALYLGQASRTAANPDDFRLAAGLCVGAAIAILLLRILRRR